MSRKILLVRLLGLLPLLTGTAPSLAQPLEGFADLHTHPMSHLAFGGMIMFGAPDIGSLMLEGQRYRGFHFGAKNCWGEGPAASIEEALGRDAPIHGGWGGGWTSFVDANNCGDHIRQKIVEKVEEKYDHPGGSHWRPGYPDFADWPRWSSVTHQQMYWEWIKRSFEGGQRVMVALAVNNELLARAANGSRAADDRSSVDLQLAQIKVFVGRHSDFMEVARTPADLRRIVRSNRLAVVLGVETDDFGNLTRRATFGGERITQAAVDAEVRRLHGLGVRYILPIHFSNTVLGGYAINKGLFALSSKYYSNAFPAVRETCGDGIHFDLRRNEFDFPENVALRSRNLGWVIDTQPSYPPPSPGCGHQNALGLTPLGRGALRTMMNLGMMIDIDHMSRLAADEALGIAEERNYPINSGHNGPVGEECLSCPGADLEHCNENSRTVAQYQRIRALGGMVGLGHAGQATEFVKTYRRVLRLMGGRSVAIGTDANGLEALPAPDPRAPVDYGPLLQRYTFGRRTWDFNVDGFAHYGLFPDYIRSWQTSSDPAGRMTPGEMHAFHSSAEDFARMWERSERRAAATPYRTDLTLATAWCAEPGSVLHTGDFNGDGMDDLLCRSPRQVAIDYADSRGRLAGAPDWSVSSSWCTHAGSTLMLADLNGDRRMDLLCKDPGRIWLDYADERGRLGGSDRVIDTTWCSLAGEELFLGDFNGDARADLLCRYPLRTATRGPGLRIDYADTGGSFTGTDWSLATTWCTRPGDALHLGDFDGDGRTDLLCRDAAWRSIQYADERGRFGSVSWTQETRWCTHRGSSLRLADVTGDGRTDQLCVDPFALWHDDANEDGQFDHPDGFLGTRWCSQAGAQMRLGDFNGDGRTDLLCRDERYLRIDYADAAGRFRNSPWP